MLPLANGDSRGIRCLYHYGPVGPGLRCPERGAVALVSSRGRVIGRFCRRHGDAALLEATRRLGKGCQLRLPGSADPVVVCSDAMRSRAIG